MKVLHPLDVRNRDGGLPTAQAAKPRSLRPATHKAATQTGTTPDGPWGPPTLPAPGHGVAHGSAAAAAKTTPARQQPPQPAASVPRARRRSRLPILIFVGLFGYWAYVNLLPPDMRDMIHDQIKAATK